MGHLLRRDYASASACQSWAAQQYQLVDQAGKLRTIGQRDNGESARPEDGQSEIKKQDALRPPLRTRKHRHRCAGSPGNGGLLKENERARRRLANWCCSRSTEFENRNAVVGVVQNHF